MLIHLAFANPLAPILVLAGVLAAGGIVFVIAQELYIRFHLRTRERYRVWRRRQPGTFFLTLLLGWGALTLGSALAYTAVDIAIYRANVAQLRATAQTGAPLSTAAAEQLLGNEHSRIVAAVVPDENGVVGTATAGGQHLTLTQLTETTYRLAIRKER